MFAHWMHERLAIKRFWSVGWVGAALLASVGLVLLAFVGMARRNVVLNPPAFSPLASPMGLGELELDLRQCRSISLGQQQRAEACNRALDRDPLHAEAGSQLRAIFKEQDVAAAMSEGIQAVKKGQFEEALQRLSQIAPAMDDNKEAKRWREQALRGAERQADKNCNKYFDKGDRRLALWHCGKLMRLSCLHSAPGGRPLNPDAALRFRRLWREFNPHAVPWTCPNGTGAVVGTFRNVFVKAERPLGDALYTYWQGRTEKARSMLGNLRQNTKNAKVLETAERWTQQIVQLEALTTEGRELLESGQILRAEAPLREAMRLDATLVDGLAGGKASRVRQRIQEQMASHAYASGKLWADRNDFAHACRIWNMGHSFYQGNIDLQRAVGLCTDKAYQELAKVVRCQDLPKVSSLSMSGDGSRERVGQKKEQLHCP